MPGSHWRSTRGDETRARLLELGARQLRQKGVAGISIRGVALDCAIGHSTVQHHFRTQEDFVRELVARWSSEVTAAIEKSAVALRGLRRSAAMARTWIERTEVRPILAEVIRPHEPGSGHDSIRSAIIDVVQKWTALLRASLAQARALGELRDGTDPRRVALELHALLWSRCWALEIEGETWTTHALLEAVWDRLSSIAVDAGAVLPPRADFVGSYDADAFDEDNDGFVPRDPQSRKVPIWYELGSRFEPQFQAFMRHARMGDVHHFSEPPTILPEDIAAADRYARRHPEEVAEAKALMDRIQRANAQAALRDDGPVRE